MATLTPASHRDNQDAGDRCGFSQGPGMLDKTSLLLCPSFCRDRRDGTRALPRPVENCFLMTCFLKQRNPKRELTLAP